MQKFCAENLRNSVSFALTAAGVYDPELLKLQVLHFIADDINVRLRVFLSLAIADNTN